MVAFEGLMLTGLLGSALVNVVFSFCPYFPLLVALWFVNGLLQSLIWTPIVRILALHFRDKVRDHAAFFMSLTLIFGYLIAWALSGLLTSLLSWRVAFRTAGLVTAAIAVPSILFMKRITWIAFVGYLAGIFCYWLEKTLLF